MSKLFLLIHGGLLIHNIFHFPVKLRRSLATIRIESFEMKITSPGICSSGAEIGSKNSLIMSSLFVKWGIYFKFQSSFC